MGLRPTISAHRVHYPLDHVGTDIIFNEILYIYRNGGQKPSDPQTGQHVYSLNTRTIIEPTEHLGSLVLQLTG